jgi:WD40 repeat protein
LWDLVAGKPLHTFAHPESVSGASFHPHDYLLSTTAGTSVRFWDLESFRLLDTVTLLSRPLVARFSEDGNALVCTLPNGIQVLNWDPVGVAEVVAGNWETAVDVWNQGDTCVVAGYLHNTISLWSVQLTARLKSVWLMCVCVGGATRDY